MMSHVRYFESRTAAVGHGVRTSDHPPESTLWLRALFIIKYVLASMAGNALRMVVRFLPCRRATL